MPKHNYALLLAGGVGSRFWPQSRTLEPKQFISLCSRDNSLFEETLKRILPLIPAENIYVATSQLYRHQFPELIRRFNLPLKNIIFENESRNTAPSIGVAARLISLRDPQGKVCILPCDHMVKRKGIFLKLLKKAFLSCNGNLVILGIPPRRPATGYGYIKVSRESLNKDKGIFRVERFLEKPGAKKAAGLCRDKRYFWNAGMFIGSAAGILLEYKTNLPLLYRQLAKIKDAQKVNWALFPSLSFDYGILEKAKNILMLNAGNLGWSDLGSWQAWDETLAKDKNKNALKGDVINLGSREITVLAKNRLIATIGLKGLIIVDTPDALLITKKDKSEEVKKIVDILKQKRRQEHYYHRTVKRPWGSYTVLDAGAGFKIKLVEVAAHKSLSLQLHKRRSEHWVVVEGKARIVRGKKSHDLNCNESAFIPPWCVHRLINPGDSALRIVEVQAGHYLKEDDIVRLKDDFGRE